MKVERTLTALHSGSLPVAEAILRVELSGRVMWRCIWVVVGICSFELQMVNSGSLENKGMETTLRPPPNMHNAAITPATPSARYFFLPDNPSVC
jgi:hypothetical protein